MLRKCVYCTSSQLAEFAQGNCQTGRLYTSCCPGVNTGSSSAVFSTLCILDVGTSSRCSDTYHGPRPFSEVETYNVAKYLLKQRRNLIGYMDIHAYSQLWMTPWGYKKAYPDDNGEQVGLCQVFFRLGC